MRREKQRALAKKAAYKASLQARDGGAGAGGSDDGRPVDLKSAARRKHPSYEELMAESDADDDENDDEDGGGHNVRRLSLSRSFFFLGGGVRVCVSYVHEFSEGAARGQGGARARAGRQGVSGRGRRRRRGR